MFRRSPQKHHDQIHTDEEEQLNQDAKIQMLRDGLGQLSARSSKFCTDSCLRRYLVAQNWDVEKARKMLEETIKWRSEFKPEEIRWHEVAHEGESGKASKANFRDREGRTVLIMRPGKQNSTSAEGSIRHLIYLIENAILNLPQGQEQMSWLVDFNGWSMSTNIPIKTAADILYILQNHYPERLAVAVLYSPPRIFQAFWTALKYFVDPNTYQKIKFVYQNDEKSLEMMKTFFDAGNLPMEFGGKAKLDYDHEEFSKLMVEDDLKTAEFWGIDPKEE